MSVAPHTHTFIQSVNFPEANQTSILALCLHLITFVSNIEQGLLEHTRIVRSLFYLLLITESFLPFQLTSRYIQIYRVVQKNVYTLYSFFMSNLYNFLVHSVYSVTLHYYIKVLSEGVLKILQIEMYFSINISIAVIMPFGKQPTSCA